jgi:8-oxo-dGTP diphosphatase
VRIRFVVGLFFDKSGEDVVLLRKTRPTWQAGKLNGPGGKIETGETPEAAMTREFMEETGVFVNSWQAVCVRSDAISEVHFFAARGDVSACQSRTEEVVEVVRVSDLHSLEIVYNLRWIIPLALDPEPGIVSVPTE